MLNISILLLLILSTFICGNNTELYLYVDQKAASPGDSTLVVTVRNFSEIRLTTEIVPEKSFFKYAIFNVKLTAFAFTTAILSKSLTLMNAPSLILSCLNYKSKINGI